MSKGNSEPDPELVRQIEEAQATLNKILSLVKGGVAPAKPPKRARAKKSGGDSSSSAALDFSMGLRAFVKKHKSGKSGAQKFTLLLAYLAKGDGKKAVALDEIVREWKTMTALLGSYNNVHALRAREADLVDSKEGLYLLRPGWKDRL